jgi:hypothetical protein
MQAAHFMQGVFHDAFDLVGKTKRKVPFVPDGCFKGWITRLWVGGDTERHARAYHTHA